MPEFTGERVIPGLVDNNLFNEHLARYRFAVRFVQPGAVVLDAGCGSGYGSAELGAAGSITGTDISADAVRYAQENFGRHGVRFVQAACERLPFADAIFDVVTTFEVIEHLEHWQKLLEESRRVLKPSGVLLVSTPNKNYYAEARAGAGPNPFHCHEFEYKEFERALYEVFPHVRLWTQNYAEAIVFAPLSPNGAVLEARGDSEPEHAYFYIAVCSQAELAANGVFAWLPSTGNALREREHHVAKLEGELTQKDGWLKQLVNDHAALHRSHEKTQAELTTANEWAERLNAQIAECNARIEELQTEAEARLLWVRDLEKTIERAHAEIHRLNAELNKADEWAQSLHEQLHERAQDLANASERLRQLREERQLITGSKWMRLGRKLNLGPVVSGE